MQSSFKAYVEKFREYIENVSYDLTKWQDGYGMLIVRYIGES